jgi:hypothetical protein
MVVVAVAVVATAAAAAVALAVAVVVVVKAVQTSEILVDVYQSTQCYNPGRQPPSRKFLVVSYVTFPS